MAADPAPTPPNAGAIQYSPASSPNLTRGDVVGRYIILDLLGSGAMGAVYRAYDPELDRRIALKLLLPWTGSPEAVQEGRKRMQREAQAMAKLAHPNVIGVFDVGTFRGDVFFTMELIKGSDLHAWFRKAENGPHPWKDVLDVFIQAGQGLAAAHAAGVVHRDFKPGNVLLGEDGRVRVLDFGIARAEEEVVGPMAGQTQLMRRADVSQTITQAGTVVGTPAYMAPEQHRGADTDARADQFAFCVALYEGLYGRRPFIGRDFKELGRAKRKGLIEREPDDTTVPTWLREAVRKGLSPGREQRYPDMESLLEDLGRDHGRSRRRWKLVAAVSGALGIGAAGAAAYAQRTDSVGICSGGEAKVAEVWNDTVKQEIEQAFEASRLKYAPGSWVGARGALDRYAGEWVDAHVDACEDTHVRGEQSEELLDTRMYCLDRHLREMKALVEVLKGADEDVVRNAVALASNLPDLAACSETDALIRRIKLPEDIQVQIQVSGLQGTLERAATLREAGKYDDAMALIDEVTAEAERVEYPPLHAEILQQRGLTQLALGDPTAAEKTLYEAVWAARACLHDEVEAEVWTALVYVVGSVQARYEQGRWFGRQAESSLEALGGMRTTVADLASHRGAVFLKEGKYDEALKEHRAALELRTELFDGKHAGVAASANDVGTVLRMQGKYEEALELHARARAIQKELLDPGHPARIPTLEAVGRIRLEQGALEKARQSFEAAYEIADNALGPDHPQRADVLTDLGDVAAREGDPGAAEAHYRNALTLRERVLGEKHPDVATSRERLADALVARGQATEALELYRQGLQAKEDVLGERHPDVIQSLRGLSRALLALDRAGEAIAHLTRAEEIVDERLGEDHPEKALTLVDLGRAQLEADRREDAMGSLERAVQGLKAHAAGAEVLADAQFLLARAAWPTDPERATELAREARSALLQRSFRAEVDAIDEWLAPRAGADTAGDSRG